MTKFQQNMRLLTLGMIFSGSVILPYIQYKFYDTLLQYTQTSNTEVGFLMVAFTIVGMCLYIPMGLLADKTSAKVQIIACTLLNAVLNVLFVFNHTFFAALIIWGLLGVTMSFWGAVVKLVRDSGSGEEQGRIFGLFYAANGITASAVGLSAAWLFSLYESPIEGFQAVLWLQAAFLLLAAVFSVLFLSDKTEYNTANVTESKESTLSLITTVLKLRATWIMVIFVFCAYGVFLGVGYMTPYTTNVLGVSLTFGAVLGTLRQYFLRVIVAPTGGFLIDRAGSGAKVLSIALVFVICLLLILLNIPATTAVGIFIAIIMIFSCFGQLIYTLMFTVLEEIKIPAHLTATAVAVISVIGYIPDALFPPLFGHWLDTYGMKDGYTIIFSFLIALSIISILVCIKIMRDAKKQRNVIAS